MKPTEFQSRKPSRGFDIDSIIGKPTHTSTHLNDTPTTGSDNSASCPTPPAGSRKTADTNGTAKPTADLPPPQTSSSREPLAAATGREGGRALPFPVPLLPRFQPRSHAFSATIGAEDKLCPRELAWRSVWGMTPSLGRGSSIGGSSGTYLADVRPSLPLQGVSRPVGPLPVGSLPLPLPLSVSPGLLGGLGVRDSLPPLPLHPWLLARRYHHHCLGYGPFSGSPEASLLYHYQWHRKPKRIRTAFSPGQLQRLERAFDTNHYMVGQERKQLADKLSLTETQVKVWFQNRRTKHKRMKIEEEENDSGDKVTEEDLANPFPHSGDEHFSDARPDRDTTIHVDSEAA